MKTMQIKKILLCYLKSEVNSSVTEPLGIEAIASVIRRQYSEIEVVLYNMQINGENDFLREFEYNCPELVGFSIPNGAMFNLRKILDVMQKTLQEKMPIILVGGIEATFQSDVLLKLMRNIYLMKGESDESILDFIDAIEGRRSISEVPNLIYYKDNILKRNIVKYPAIESIPIPSRDLLLESIKLGGYAYLETSRGCSWGHCTFCIRKCNNESHRRFLLEKVLADFDQLRKFNVKAVYLTDEEFLGQDDAWLDAFSDELIKMENKIDIYATCQSISIWKENEYDFNRRRKKLLLKLNEAGLKKMYLGTESGSMTQLKRYGKSANVCENIKAIEILRELGFAVGIGFIMFDPFMGLNELRENINFIEKLNIIGNIFTPFHCVDVRPGSGYEKMLNNSGLLKQLDLKSNCYYFDFADKNVGDIYKFCHTLLNRHLDFQLNLRQIANTSGNRILQKLSKGCKVMQLCVLKKLCDIFNNLESLVELENMYDDYFENCYKNAVVEISAFDKDLVVFFTKKYEMIACE